MLKVKKSLAGMAIFFASFCAFSQVKSYVGIVRQQYFPEHSKYFANYRDELNQNGYSTYAKYVDSYLKGSFGSGFVYVASDGTNYIITNRHVVSQAATASVEFENPDTGDITKYEKLTVLLTDDDIDIAVLGFANGEKPFKRGMTLSTAAVTDGQEVWSAGFPGLGNEPVWQLGKGTVTNARARIKDLLDPNISTIIQHSAQIDGGNSGGPLMIASSKGTAGYEVVGINTWKASYRDSTNFSIPASQIKKMIEGVQKKADDAEDGKVLAARTSKLSASLKDLGSDFSVLAKYISYERASTQGQKDFDSVLHFAPTKVRSAVLEMFSFDPAEGLRYACAYQLWKKYSAESTKGENFTASEPKVDGSKATVDFTGDGEKAESVTTTWIKEHGLWRLSELSTDVKADDKGKKSKKSAKSSDSSSESKDSGSVSDYFGSPEIESYDNVVLLGGADMSSKGNKNGFFAGLDFFGDDSWFGYSLSFHKVTAEIFEEDVGFGVFGFGAALRIPVRMGQFALNPYGKLAGTFGYGDSRVMLGYVAEAGLQAMFNTCGDVHFGFGAGYKQLYLSQFMDQDINRTTADPDPFTNRAISLYGIISF